MTLVAETAANKRGGMNTDSYRALYMLNGFFWNGELYDFVVEYAGKEINYRHPKTRSDQLARFIRPVQINIGRFSEHYEAITSHLREEVAPVGDCNAAHIELILTETGRLLGHADSVILRWGEESAPWRSAISSLLLGMPPTVVGELS
jgi:hypothetical protein